MSPVRSSSFAFAFGLLLVAAAAHGQTGSAPGVVNLYTARHYDTDLELYQRFTAATGIKVRAIEGDSAELIERIRSEGANSPADVLITVDVANLARAETASLFQPLADPAITGRVDPALVDPEDHWVAITKRARILVYRKADGPPPNVARYEDLANPALGQAICVRSSNNPYNQSLMASVIAHNGVEAAEAWARGVVANLARPPEGNDTSQIDAVAAGQCDLALVNHYYLARLLASDDPQRRAVGEAVAALFPNQQDRGTHINISAAGIATHAPHPEAARAFIAFVLGAEAQRLIADENEEYPAARDVAPSTAAASLGAFKADSLPLSLLGANQAKAVQAFDRAGWQ